MLVKPTLIVPDITTLDLSLLQTLGVRGFIFDLDNTLMPPHSGKLSEHMTHWLLQVHQLGFRSIVVSNNHRLDYLAAVEQLLGFPVIGNAKKPRRKFLRKALELLELEAEEVAVVGDRPLTDIWGGQRLGTYTVLVDPLNKRIESPIIQNLRRLERLFVIEATSHDPAQR